MITTHTLRLFIWTGSMFFLSIGLAWSDGFRNTPEGARAVGTIGAYRVFADDANTVIHNSANMVDITSPTLQLNVTGGDAETTFDGIGGSDKTEKPYYATPGLSLAVPMSKGRYALGFAAYIPFGRMVDWGDNDYFAINGYPYRGEMTVADFTPNFAIRIIESVSLGVGMDFYYGEVRQEQLLYGLEQAGIPNGTRSEIKADDTTFGWNASLRWKMTEKQRLAMSYRSSFVMDYHGNNKYKTANTTTESSVDAKIEYPAIASLSYGIILFERLRAACCVEWLEFSVYQDLVIRDSALPMSISSPQKLDDTWTYGISGEWDITENWIIRSGYKYLNAPTPESTYSTLSTDADQGVVSLGIGYETEKQTVDIGYAYGLSNGRSIQGSANSPDGDYDYNVQILTLSYGYKF